MLRSKMLSGHAVCTTEITSVRNRNTQVAQGTIPCVHQRHVNRTVWRFLNLYCKGS